MKNLSILLLILIFAACTKGQVCVESLELPTEPAALIINGGIHFAVGYESCGETHLKKRAIPIEHRELLEQKMDSLIQEIKETIEDEDGYFWKGIVDPRNRVIGFTDIDLSRT